MKSKLLITACLLFMKSLIYSSHPEESPTSEPPTLPQTSAPQSSSFNVRQIPVLQQGEVGQQTTSTGSPLISATNCGYHSIHNSSVALDHLRYSGSFNQELQQSLNDRPLFVSRADIHAPHIHAQRKSEIIAHLLDISDTQPIVADALKTQDLDLPHETLKLLRDFMTDSRMKSYINPNTGQIRTDMLSFQEVQQLVNIFEQGHQQHIAVLDSQAVQAYESPLTDREFLHQQYPELEATMDKIRRFQQEQNDTLAILWTEPGFNHWVTYVAHKANGKVTVYTMNSHVDAAPRQEQQVFNLLKPKAGSHSISVQPIAKITPSDDKSEESWLEEHKGSVGVAGLLAVAALTTTLVEELEKHIKSKPKSKDKKSSKSKNKSTNESPAKKSKSHKKDLTSPKKQDQATQALIKEFEKKHLQPINRKRTRAPRGIHRHSIY